MALPTGLAALPAAGDRSYQAILRKLRLLVLRRLLSIDQPSPALSRVQALLRRVAKGSRHRDLLRALGGVDVLAPVLCIEGGAQPTEPMLRRAVPALLARLGQHLAGHLDGSALWDLPLAELPLQDALYRFDPPAHGVLLDPSGLMLRTGAAGTPFELPGGAAEGVTREQPFFPVAGQVRLSTYDSNPLALLEAHPDKGGNAIDLGGRDPDEWVAALRQALSLVEVLPHLHAELCATLERVVPVGYEPERHLSASYREAPGLVYLTLHPSPLIMAEALIHETQHGKLNALSWFDPLLENGDGTWTTSPVRPDLRPLRGVLMAAHAFVPVAALHARLAESGHPIAADPTFERRRREVLAANRAALATLSELGRPTPLGVQVLAALEELHSAVAPRAVDSGGGEG